MIFSNDTTRTCVFFLLGMVIRASTYQGASMFLQHRDAQSNFSRWLSAIFLIDSALQNKQLGGLRFITVFYFHFPPKSGALLEKYFFNGP